MLNVLYKIKNNLRIEGAHSTFKKLISYNHRKKQDNKIIREKLIKPSEIEYQKNYKFECNNLISIVVPLYKTKTKFLADLIDSVILQTYPYWELCLADGSGDDKLKKYISTKYSSDNRINYKLLKGNYGISVNTNKAIEMSKGDIIVFIDHDDFIESNALFEINKVFNNNKKTELVYTDEDVTDSKGVKFFSPKIKPDFNIDLLRNVNYICHLVAVKKELLKEVGGLTENYDGAQDFDFILKCAEKTNNIEHISKILYHWRSHEKSTANNDQNKKFAVEAAVNSLKNHYSRLGINAKVSYTGTFIVLNTKYYMTNNPMVSILVLNSSDSDDLETCINSIVSNINYNNYEILIVDKPNNNEFTECYRRLMKSNSNIQVVQNNMDENYSKSFNNASEYAKGEYLLLLNSNAEITTNFHFDQIVGAYQRNDIGVIGVKMIFKDDLIYNAGILINKDCSIEELKQGNKNNYKNNAYGFNLSRDVDTTYPYFTFLSKKIFEKVGKFDEDYDTEYSNYDFCLKIKQRGLLIFYIPNIEVRINKTVEINSKKDKERFLSIWSKTIAGSNYSNEL